VIVQPPVLELMHDDFRRAHLDYRGRYNDFRRAHCDGRRRYDDFPAVMVMPAAPAVVAVSGKKTSGGCEEGDNTGK